MQETDLQDSYARERALDPNTSFIIQAPAGSGKTSLLVQRYISLLSVVDRPEEILAITFTRKAASEMRERILEKLAFIDLDNSQIAELSKYEQKSYQLAKKAKARDESLNWELRKNPSRLQILTIDAFCSRLVSAMPVASGFGGMPNLIEDAKYFYRKAVNQYFKYFLKSKKTNKNLEILLLELNNDFDRVSNLLVSMLGKRDQWLSYVSNDYLIKVNQLNLALEAAIEQDLIPLKHTLREGLWEELIAMSSYAAESLTMAGRESEICACLNLSEVPQTNFSSLSVWRGIRKLFLTEKGTIRSRVSIAEGFAPESSTNDIDLRNRYKAFKERMQFLLADLKNENGFIEALNLIKEIPLRQYTENDYEFLNALFSVLKNISAELIVEFQRTTHVDFIELTQSALLALGFDENPTDLALSFDSRINHILVDEFQDTSRLHLELLRKLTIAWGDDNRSLFVVGDPMQSIYRFRDADVKNFLRLKQNGINSIGLEFLQLETNFRSASNLVNANNDTFVNLFPSVDNLNTGDVAFHASTAVNDNSSFPSISLQAIESADRELEACEIIELIKRILDNDADATIAVLVKSRTHLENLVPLIRVENFYTTSEGMEKLIARQEVLDLYALTMALVQATNRQAWLSVLRAPWCGLSLRELEYISNCNTEALIFEILTDKTRLIALSEDSQERIQCLVSAFDIAFTQLHKEQLFLVIETLWINLNGPESLESEEQYANVENFFKILRTQSYNSILDTTKPFSGFLKEFTRSSNQTLKTQVQLLTIHMAKGLEFDHVIIPGASRTTRGNDTDLLVWNEFLDSSSNAHLLLSQYQPLGDNAIYNYIKRRNNRLAEAELKRLLYVAMTRSIKATYIFCESKSNKSNDIIVAPQGSFSHLLTTNKSLIQNVKIVENTKKKDRFENIMSFKRQKLKSLKIFEPGEDINSGIVYKEDDQLAVIDYEWASETAMHIGTVVHLALNQLGSISIDEWLLKDQREVEQHFARVLKTLGVPDTELNHAVERTLKALNLAATDKERSWIFSSEHSQIENEFAISGFINGQFKNFRLDRTFVDSKGVRWIIDYKTSHHEGGSLSDFLDNEILRYKAQLDDYAVLMKQIDQREIRLGMYFPLMQAWREWAYVE